VPAPATITACVITLNEERRLPRCLHSLRFCDEVVVVDSGSTDRTHALAQAAGAKFITNPWPGFGAQRNLAISRASSDWILEIDADEWLSPELVGEIGQFLRQDSGGYDMGVIPLREHYLGRPLGPSAHYPFYRPRLFRRGAYWHDETRTVHEGLHPRTLPWIFTADMHHERADRLAEALRDAHAYAQLEARQLSPRGPSAYLAGIALRPAAKFLYQLLVLGGWRDSWRGVLKTGIECAADAEVWLRHIPRRQAPSPEREDEGPPPPHYGRRKQRVGPIRLAAVGRVRALERPEVRRWLDEAVACGGWVTVFTPGSGCPGHGGLRHHALPRLAPIALMRALDAERQLGPLDATVALDASARAVLSAIPGAVRSYSPILGLDRPAGVVVQELRRSSRGEQ
jgi:hypothetical protein